MFEETRKALKLLGEEGLVLVAHLMSDLEAIYLCLKKIK